MIIVHKVFIKVIATCTIVTMCSKSQTHFLIFNTMNKNTLNIHCSEK